MATDADPDNKKKDEPIEIEAAQGKTSAHDFSPSERAFLDEVSAPWWKDAEQAQPGSKDRSARPRRRLTH